MREHQCHVCEKRDTRGPTWQQYGSLALDEECGHHLATCSDTCRSSAKGLTAVRDFEVAHRGKCRWEP